MRVGEPDAAPSQPIQVGGEDGGGSVAGEIAVADIVGVDQENVRKTGAGGGCQTACRGGAGELEKGSPVHAIAQSDTTRGCNAFWPGERTAKGRRVPAL